MQAIVVFLVRFAPICYTRIATNRGPRIATIRGPRVATIRGPRVETKSTPSASLSTPTLNTFALTPNDLYYKVQKCNHCFHDKQLE